MADQLATPSDLASLLQQDVDTATATLLLEAATATVQAVTGQRIVRVTNDTVVIDLDELDGSLFLNLPERPVVSVGAVLIGTTAVTDFSSQLSRARLYRADGWRSTLAASPSSPSTVTVTYTHGYASGDQRLQPARSAVLMLAAGAYTNPGGASREQIDDYAVAYEATASRMDASPFLVAALRRRYGRPTRSVRLLAG